MGVISFIDNQIPNFRDSKYNRDLRNLRKGLESCDQKISTLFYDFLNTQDAAFDSAFEYYRREQDTKRNSKSEAEIKYIQNEPQPDTRYFSLENTIFGSQGIDSRAQRFERDLNDIINQEIRQRG
jgi:hypothetical protein